MGGFCGSDNGHGRCDELREGGDGVRLPFQLRLYFPCRAHGTGRTVERIRRHRNREGKGEEKERSTRQSGVANE